VKYGRSRGEGMFLAKAMDLPSATDGPSACRKPRYSSLRRYWNYRNSWHDLELACTTPYFGGGPCEPLVNQWRTTVRTPVSASTVPPSRGRAGTGRVGRTGRGVSRGGASTSGTTSRARGMGRTTRGDR
jgi:hypothetical protein